MKVHDLILKLLMYRWGRSFFSFVIRRNIQTFVSMAIGTITHNPIQIQYVQTMINPPKVEIISWKFDS